MGGIYGVAVEIDSGAMIYIPSFIKIGSGIRKLFGWDTQTHRQHGDRISLLLFFRNKESRLKTQISLSFFSMGTTQRQPLPCLRSFTDKLPYHEGPI
jgi:hypothetical protein